MELFKEPKIFKKKKKKEKKERKKKTQIFKS